VSTPSACADAGVLIVGAGQAGGRAAEALREANYDGPITLVGDEIHLPYERPSLSKEFLHDAAAHCINWIRPAQWYRERSVTLIPGRLAQRLDRNSRSVELDDGSALNYSALIMATGTRVRPLTVEGADHPAVAYLRTLDDSRCIQPRLLPGAHIVVIGAGFIGMEVAAAAVQRGCRVTVLEAGALPMARGLPPLVSRFYADLHRSHGVDLRLSSSVHGIADESGRAIVQTNRGNLSADAVIVGIGVTPNIQLADSAGLDVDNGIVVDEFGRTTDPSIYAAGDVTSHFNPLLKRRIRLESWQNAQNQAIAVARNIMGAGKPYAEVPWFWSDQFGLNLQIAGIVQADDQIVQRGVLGAGPALLFHLRREIPVAAVGIDCARDLRFAREIIALGLPVSAAVLADAGTALASVYGTLKRSARAA
jgi:NADPH-dependent 2,4-dienoyl-CoA reductase/sulfur reductase-like enzyme